MIHMKNRAGRKITLKDVLRAQLFILKRDLYAAAFSLRRRMFLQKKIVACVFSTGERTEEQSILSVKRQRFPVSRIEVIRNVSPISAASNRVFDLASDADYVLWVDADMILYQNCTQYLIRLAKSNVLFTAGGLIDPAFGVIGWVKLLNMNLVQELDIRFRNVLRCDVDFQKQALEKDDNVIPRYSNAKKILGIHHGSYTTKELFRKAQIWRKKRGNSLDKRLLRSLTKKYCETGNNVLLAGIIGTILPNPDDSDGESSPESGLANWPVVSGLLGSQSEDSLFEIPGRFTPN
jgi:hypothetical protein